MAESNRNEPNRDQAVESNVLLRRASWCGVVTALAVVLSCLNFMPPIEVCYQVRSSAVISEARLGQLRDLVIADREAVKLGKHQRIQLLSVKVLDLANQEESLAHEPSDEKVVLVEIGSLWSNRCTAERHYTWLKNISRVDAAKVRNGQAAISARMARWELEAAQHYLTQHKFLSDKEPLPEPEIPSNIASNDRRQTFQLASFGQPTKATQSATDTTAQADGNESILSGNADFGLQLTEQVDIAKEQLKLAELDLKEQIEKSSGILQIANIPVISPRSTSIPYWMAASILILGLATGSSASWYEIKRESGDASQPTYVASQLALDSVPLAGTLLLPIGNDALAAAELKPDSKVRKAGPLNRLSEWAITFWVVIAIGRFFLDSVWRDVLVDSPLAALGRLVTGMP